jgi:hypothetical protein
MITLLGNLMESWFFFCVEYFGLLKPHCKKDLWSLFT